MGTTLVGDYDVTRGRTGFCVEASGGVVVGGVGPEFLCVDGRVDFFGRRL
jgi:hypothetical protein